MDYDEAVLSYATLARRVMEPGADVGAAVTAFVAPFRDADAETAEGLLWAAWTAVVDAAEDAGDDRQGALVALVLGVRDQDANRPFEVLGRRLFADLPVFGAQMREAWNPVPPDGRTAQSWARLNAFAARLTARGVDFTLFGLWSIGEALETFADVPSHLPAAVQWFKHCGPVLVTATIHGRTYGPGPGRLHELAERAGLTEGGFNVPRWTFWRSRMAGLAHTGDPVARDGLRYMRRFDARIAAAGIG